MQDFHSVCTPNNAPNCDGRNASHPSPRVRWRARLLLACAKAPSVLQVAHHFDGSWRTVQAAVRRDQTGGLRGLAEAPHPGRPPKVQPRVRS